MQRNFGGHTTATFVENKEGMVFYPTLIYG
jgi:hypothetical protein